MKRLLNTAVLFVMGVFVGHSHTLYAKPLPTDNIDVFLTAVQTAAEKTNYSGPYIYQQGNHLQSSFITHVFNTRGEYERIELQDDGDATEFLRFNQQIKALKPNKKLVVLSSKVTGDRFPGILVKNKTKVGDYYHLNIEQGLQRVAGRLCQPVRLSARDTYRYSFKLCVDAETHLLLKVETLDENNTVLETVAFTNVRQGNKTNFSRIYSDHNTQAWTVLTEEEQTNLANPRPFWPKSQLGFSIVKTPSTKKGTQLPSSSHFYLSDGLASVSVFLEPKASASSTSVLRTQEGLVSFLRVPSGPYLVTLVGEVPMKTLENLVNGLSL